jgi:hypothetical protein
LDMFSPLTEPCTRVKWMCKEEEFL